MTFPRLWLLAFAFVACHPAPPSRPTPIGAMTTRGAEPSQWTPEMHDAAKALANASYPSGRAAIEAAMRGSHRAPGAAERDKYRHPVETLSFFGFEPTMTVLDVGPGRGWYTELLAPALANGGMYIATNLSPPATAVPPSEHHWTDYEGQQLDALLCAAPELYGKVQVIRVNYKAPKLYLDRSVDMVLLMREVHMMRNWGTLDTWLREIHRALKPSGILGVEDHRALPGSNPDDCAKTGYLPEAWVIAKIESVGFALAGKSEINANPKDTKDYPEGVWSLPPSFMGGVRDRAKYTTIGKSDRMTLRFVSFRIATRKPGTVTICRWAVPFVTPPEMRENQQPVWANA